MNLGNIFILSNYKSYDVQMKLTNIVVMANRLQAGTVRDGWLFGE